MGAATLANHGPVHIVQQDDVQLNTNAADADQSVGRMYWDATNGTVSLDLTDEGGGNDVTLQIGQEQHIYAKNTSGSKITNGQAVKISGASGNRIAVGLAQADTLANSRAVAIATADVDANDFGYFTTFGRVGELNTNSYTEGDMLYLSPSSAGALTNTIPTTGIIVRIGVVENKSTNQGSIHVHIGEPWAFGDATNNTRFEADGTMVHSGNATVWEDENVDLSPLQSGGTAPGFTTIASTGIRCRSFAVGETVEGVMEIPHAYKIGSTITPHIHFIPVATTTGTDNVKWQFTYVIVDNGDVVSAASTPVDTGDVAIDTQWKRYDANFGTFTHDTLGGQILWKLERIAAAGDAFAGEAAVLTFGFHYERDMHGSRQITTK